MLWEAATGRRLWKGIPDLTVLHRLINGDIPAPSTVDPNVPEGLEKIVMKALALKREDRYATAVDLAAALEELLDAMGDKNSLREVGKLVARHFEDNRNKIKQIVETQLKVAKSLPTTEFQAISLPHLDAPSLSGAMSTTGQRDAVGSRSDLTGQRGPAPSTPSSLTASTAAAGMAQPARSSKGGVLGVVAVLGVAAIGAGAWYMSRQPVAPPPAPAAPVASATVAPASHVEITINVSPAEAKLYLDGKLLPQNPYVGKFARDDGTHIIRAEAPGYATKNRDITFEKDRSFDITLEHQTAQGTPSAEPRDVQTKTKVILVPQPGQPPPDDMKTGGTKKTNRTIDQTNPYGP
jgi:serine/threonine-protein kinase